MKSGFVEHLDESFERAMMEIDRNIRDSIADREAKSGLFSILFKKPRKNTPKKNKRNIDNPRKRDEKHRRARR